MKNIQRNKKIAVAVVITVRWIILGLSNSGKIDYMIYRKKLMCMHIIILLNNNWFPLIKQSDPCILKERFLLWDKSLQDGKGNWRGAPTIQES